MVQQKPLISNYTSLNVRLAHFYVRTRLTVIDRQL